MLDNEKTTPDHDMTAEASLCLGDSLFVDEDYSQAVDAYAAALLVLREDDLSSASLKIRILSHRSAAFYRLRNYQDALEDALQALGVLSEAKNVSGLRNNETENCHKRAGLAYSNLQNYQQAKVQFEKAQQLATLNRGDEKAYKSYIKQCEYNLKPRQQASPTSTFSPPPGAASKPPPSAAPKPAASAASKSPPKAATKPQSQQSASNPKTTATTSKKMPVKNVPKYQYYQDDKFMTIQILASKVKEEEIDVRFERKHLTVKLMRDGVNHTVVCGNLYSEVDVDGCKVKIKDEKVLIKMKKVDLAFEWPELLGKKSFPEPSSNAAHVGGETKTDEGGMEASPAAPAAEAVPKGDTNRPRPYASHRDWDKIEKELADQEKEEKPEGDEAMNKLFQTIYASADEDTRRAMVKSYQTSGGTVLSTNWGEVKDKDYEEERTAPKGMEWKNWEGQKLPMKDDD